MSWREDVPWAQWLMYRLWSSREEEPIRLQGGGPLSPEVRFTFFNVEQDASSVSLRISS